MWRVVFMGTPHFAVPSLEALCDHPQIEVCGVVTQPDRRSGRGQRLQAPPVKEAALRHAIPILQPPKLRKNAGALEFIDQCRPDLLVVVAFGQILPAEIFNHPPGETLNVHASLLPAYRGAAPIAHALLNGEKESGVTIMKIEAGLDSGDILTQRPVAVPIEWNSEDLADCLSQLGAELLVETIPGWMSGQVKGRPQDHDRATLAPRLSKQDAPIRWQENSASQIHNQIRALHPWPVATTRLRDQHVKVWRSEFLDEEPVDAPAGAILADGPGLMVACREGRLRLLEVQLAGRKRVSGTDLVNGLGLQAGERFD